MTFLQPLIKENEMFTVKIAGIPIEIDNKYQKVYEIAKDYITNDKPEFRVSATEEEMNEERINSETDYSLPYYESVVIFRHIAENVPKYDTILFHSAVIETEQYAYAITANSGVGKTTHMRLWLSEFRDEVKVLNGDKPLFRFFDGIPHACGTPWQGKENYGHNSTKPLRAIIFLERGEKNVAEPIEIKDALVRFMNQVYLPKKSSSALVKTLSLSDRLLRSVKLVRLSCNMDPEAAHVCRAAISENGKI